MTKIFVTGTRGIPNTMGGIETHCEELFPRLADLGMDITLARRSKYANDGLKEWRGVKLLNLKTPRNKSLEAIIHSFRAINRARAMGMDVVHIHAVGPALLTPWARLLGMNVVFTHHGPDYDRDKWGALAKFILRLGERMGCRFANDVIVISDLIRKQIASKYGRTERVHLIYNGVSTPGKCSLPDYFQELGIEQGKYILGMCRFVPEKNLHHLVEAFASIPNKPADMKLVLAGDSDFNDAYTRKLKEEARSHGVVLTGFVKGEKQHALLTNCRAFCLPSSHEGLPISLLEAMSYGVKVVVSDIPANMEVGLDTDDYFPCGDIETLAMKLKNIIDQPLQHIDYDMNKYNWDKIALQVKAVYDQF